MIEIVALHGIGEVSQGDDLAELLANAIVRNGLTLAPDDVLVVTSKIVSKSENRFASVSNIAPSDEAVRLSELTLKDPRLVELALRESVSVVRAAPNVLILRHRQGWVLANAGIDASNIGAGRKDQVLLLPVNPDGSAARIATDLNARGHTLAVVISDSFGRPWRMGVVNVAIGVSGLPALVDRRGDVDRDGRVLQVTQVALADNLAAAAGLVAGEGAEGVPAVLIRGCPLPPGDAPAAELVRPLSQDLFS